MGRQPPNHPRVYERRCFGNIVTLHPNERVTWVPQAINLDEEPLSAPEGTQITLSMPSLTLAELASIAGAAGCTSM